MIVYNPQPQCRPCIMYLSEEVVTIHYILLEVHHLLDLTRLDNTKQAIVLLMFKLDSPGAKSDPGDIYEDIRASNLIVVIIPTLEHAASKLQPFGSRLVISALGLSLSLNMLYTVEYDVDDDDKESEDEDFESEDCDSEKRNEDFRALVSDTDTLVSNSETLLVEASNTNTKRDEYVNMDEDYMDTDSSENCDSLTEYERRRAHEQEHFHQPEFMLIVDAGATLSEI
ncbi:hypothetical protein EW145_g4882 [Phellinidium pouzarii]|uniref:Uncharacterized protein n=1 Tax=Phellinidium pouzarii TaxID=167371 RepID=A0A4S4L3C2_9AGAM|nr:hypothetical protein EW145_g4882 [Phellinidium pouzarii]